MAIVVSILEKTLDAARAAADRVEPAADLIEFRVDAMQHVDFESLLSGRKKATIVACPNAEAGGQFQGSPENCILKLLDAAAAGASYVDVDWRLADRMLELPGRCRKIISFHRAEGMPADPHSALQFLDSLAGPLDLIKFVPHADRLEDALDLAKITLDGRGRIIAFATGRAAMVSRLLAIAAGAPLVYAAPLAGAETAPGQPTIAELRAVLPPRGGGATTSIFAVVGNPIGHSLSPAVHSIALRLLGFDAMFLAFEPANFISFFEKISKLPFMRGLAVTSPFKEDALRQSDRADDPVRQIVAANTLVRTPDGWRALNTDDDGAADAVELGMEAKLFGKKILILGTGGAARAAAAGVRRRGADVTFAGRRFAQAELLAKHFAGSAIEWNHIKNTEYDVLINATPVGQWPNVDISPVDADAIRPGSVVMDAVVRPLDTKLGRLAAERGAKFVPGVNWFLLQAVRQIRFFTGSEPPLAPLRAAALDALKREPKPLPGMLK
ncbi:MAG: type I 3-dehydroquinate dehydratase [Planctomycetota bacterium]